MSEKFGILSPKLLGKNQNYYELLGVSPKVDIESLRKAFRKLSKELHPDTTSLPSKQASFRFQQICEAYENLSDSNLRAQYDESLREFSLENVQTASKSPQVKQLIIKERLVDSRRSLSGGELFALTLLTISILISLFVAIVFAYMKGVDLNFTPSWLID